MISAALFIIGLLILVPTGLCIAFFGVLGLINSDLSGFGFILMFAVLPALVGGVLVYSALQSREGP